MQMTDKYSDLKKAALAATPGPWECREAEGGAAICHAHGWVADDFSEQTLIDTRYMALANPAAVLAILADLEGYQQGAAVEAREADAGRKEVKLLNHKLTAYRKMRISQCEQYDKALLDISAQRDQLKAEAESLCKDAERYRYMRSCSCKFRSSLPNHEPVSEADFDADCDASLNQEPQS